MRDWVWIIIIVGIVLPVEMYRLYKVKGNKTLEKDFEKDKEKPSITVGPNDYQARYLLTKYEWKNFQTLKRYAAKNKLIVCPKIRLADLVEPKEGKSWSERQTLFNRIKSKHVDFVLCDHGMRVKLIVELDDSSHQREDRKERDVFVDSVLTQTGYKIVHVPKFDDVGVAAIDAAFTNGDFDLNKGGRAGTQKVSYKNRTERKEKT